MDTKKESYKKLYKKALYSASYFMTGNKDDAILYGKELHSRIASIDISYQKIYERNKKNSSGIIKHYTNLEGKDNIFAIWILKSKDQQKMIKALIHELNHATTISNSIIRKEKNNHFRYCGFTKTSTDGKIILPGDALDELVNELLTYIQYFHFYNYYPQYTADTVFNLNQNYWVNDEGDLNTYMELMSIPRLLGIACENNPNTSYEELLNTNISPANGLVIGRNGETEYVNDMITAAKYNRISLEKDFYYFTGDKDSFNILLNNTELLLSKFYKLTNNPKRLNNKTKALFKETFDIIKTYHDNKAEYFLDTGFWNKNDYDKSNQRFNSMYQEVLDEFKIKDNTKPKRMVK